MSDSPGSFDPPQQPAAQLSTPELSRLFELSLDLLAIAGADGYFRQVNPACERVLGYTAAELKARPFFDFIYADDRAASQHQLDQLLQGQPTINFVNRFICKGGGYRWLEWSVTPVRQHQQIDTFYCVARDVSARIEAEAKVAALNQELEDRVNRRTAELQRANQRQQELLRAADLAQAQTQLYADAIYNVQLGVYIWQLQDPSDLGSFRLVATNPAASKMTGAPMAEVLQKTMREGFPDLLKTEVPQIYADVIRTGDQRSLGEVTYGDDRIAPSVFLVRAFALPQQCVGVIFENITDRKRQELELREQKEQFQIIFEQADVGMARLGPSGQWLQVNQKLCSILGYSPEALVELDFRDITHPEDLDQDEIHYRAILSGQQQRAALEKRYLRRDGSIVWTNVMASAVRGPEGQLLSFIAVIEDISERKQAELTLKAQRDELAAVNELLTRALTTVEARNQELDQFAYVTSHDLKAPLRAIANLATWLEEDLTDQLSPENQRQMALLQGRVSRMEKLIDGLLAYSRVGRKHVSPERVDVAALLAEEISALLSDEGVYDGGGIERRFEITVAPGMPVLQARRIPLQQVFANLLSNAVKHHDRDYGAIAIGVSDRGSFYEFAVTDDGPGIASEYHDKIFVIFQTLQPRDSFESTGIGLSIVKKTVEMEGGQIWVESDTGRGVTFRFTWPKQPKGTGQ